MTEEADVTEETTETPKMKVSTVKLLWLMVLIVIQLASFFVGLQAPTVFGNAIGMAVVPLLVNILLVGTWFLTGGISFKMKCLWLLVYAGSIVFVFLTHTNGAELTLVSLTVLSTTMTLAYIISSKISPATSKKFVLGSMAIVLVGFTALRVDDVVGVVPAVGWRWAPPLELSADSWSGSADRETPISLAKEIGANDWAEFRGPRRDNVVPNIHFAADWDELPPAELWRTRVGVGFSSFSVVGDYMFTQEQRGENEVIVCYEVGTGSQVWVNSIAGRFDDSHGDGPRATPTYLDGRVYSQCATGVLLALDAETGETVWQRDLKKDSGAAIPMWGFSSSPLLYKDSVIVFAGGSDDKSVVAYNKDDGEIKWMSGSGTHGYTSGHLVTISKVEQVLFGSNIGIQSFDPINGDVLWEHTWPINTNPRCVQPLMLDETTVFLGTAGGMGTRKLHVTKNDNEWIVEEQWTTRKFRPYFNDFVHYDGHLYGYDGKRLKCINIETGKQVWQAGNIGGQVLLVPDMESLLVLSVKGKVMLVDASPEAYNVTGSFDALKGKTWNHPVIAGNKLIVRNSHEAACFELDMLAESGD